MTTPSRQIIAGFLCGLLLTSCTKTLFVGAYVLGSVAGPPYVAIESGIKNAQERRERWNSYPAPYRELMTGFSKYDAPPESYPARYDALLALLRQHSLLPEDQERNLNVLQGLAFIAWKAINEVHWKNEPGPSPYIERIMAEAEYFFSVDEPGKLNAMIGDAILSTAFMIKPSGGQMHYNGYDGFFNEFFKVTPTLSQVMGNATQEQRHRLAALLLHGAETVKFEDMEKLNSRAQEMKAARLFIALQASPGQEQRALIADRLQNAFYGCFVEKRWCSGGFARYAYNWLRERAEDEEERARLFVLAVEHHFRESIFSPVSWSKVLHIAGSFSKPEHKVTVLINGWKLLKSDEPAHHEVRGSLYYFWKTYKDERCLRALSEFMPKASRFSYYGYNPTDPLFYRSEIAMMNGQVEEALNMRAQSIVNNWDAFYKGDRKKYSSWNGQRIPYINEEGMDIGFTWPRPVSFYARDRQGGYWKKQSSARPDDILIQLYMGADKCQTREVAYKEQAFLSEAQCVREVARHILHGR